MELEIGGRRFAVERVLTKNRTASAKMRDGRIVVSLPVRWPSSERERVAGNLLRRVGRAIEKGRWRPEAPGKVLFSNGQRVLVCGKEFEVRFIPSSRFGGRLDGRKVEVRVVEGHPEKERKASDIARSVLTAAVIQEVRERVDILNERHFGSAIAGVTLKDMVSRWGSCSPDGSISLSFRLLFMPQEILDYVIVHEIAHTKYKSHGTRFWALVERASPDYRETRKWLRENGWKYPVSSIQPPVSGPETQDTMAESETPSPGALNPKPETQSAETPNRKPLLSGQQKLADFYDEPY
ncbi:MAG: M48 family metallopeptidase [Candidatus Micrarchaeota archaeon]